jgi:hypothetical protein
MSQSNENIQNPENVETYYNNVINEISRIQALEEKMVGELMYGEGQGYLPQFFPSLATDNCGSFEGKAKKWGVFNSSDKKQMTLCGLDKKSRAQQDGTSFNFFSSSSANCKDCAGSVQATFPVQEGSISNATIRSMPLGASEVDSNTLYGMPNRGTPCLRGDEKVGWISVDSMPDRLKTDAYGITLCRPKIDPNNYDKNVSRKKSIIDTISQLTDLRMKLYKNLELNLGTYQSQFNSSRDHLENQLTMVNVVERQLNNNKEVLNRLKSAQTDKVRMIEIGNYESERYNAHKNILYIVLATIIIVFLFSLLTKFPIVPGVIPFSGIVITITVGVIMVFYKLVSVYSRSNRNFLEFDWGGNSSYSDPSMQSVYKDKSKDNLAGKFDPNKLDDKYKNLLKNMYKKVEGDLHKELADKANDKNKNKCDE